MSLAEGFDLVVFFVLFVYSYIFFRMRRWGGATHKMVQDLRIESALLRASYNELWTFKDSIENDYPQIQEHIDLRNKIAAQIERDFMTMTALDVRLNKIDHNWELTNAKVNGLEHRYRNLLGDKR